MSYSGGLGKKVCHRPAGKTWKKIGEAGGSFPGKEVATACAACPAGFFLAKPICYPG